MNIHAWFFNNRSAIEKLLKLTTLGFYYFNMSLALKVKLKNIFQQNDDGM